MAGSSWVEPGSITEIVGPLCSGRTSLLVACLRDATAAGATVALVDVDETFDPDFAARAGVVLSRLLWVRGRRCRATALAALDALVRCPGFALVALDAGETPPRLTLAHAFRLRQAAGRSGAAVILMGCRRVAGAAATLAVRTRRGRLAWAGAGRCITRLAGMSTAVQVVRKQGAPAAADECRWWTA